MSQRPMLPPGVDPPPTPPARPAAVKIAVGLVVALLVLGAVVLWVGGGTERGAQPPPTSDAQPYVRDFAGDLSGEVHSALEVPETFSHGPSVDGCDHGYGVRGECVPYNFPPGVANTPAAKCDWLASHRFGALEVPGSDRHGLVPADGPRAPSGHPYACPNELPLTAKAGG